MCLKGDVPARDACDDGGSARVFPPNHHGVFLFRGARGGRRKFDRPLRTTGGWQIGQADGLPPAPLAGGRHDKRAADFPHRCYRGMLFGYGDSEELITGGIREKKTGAMRFARQVFRTSRMVRRFFEHRNRIKR